LRREKIQTSETFILSALLALSGGFQDAYTYILRDKVFANAQTGNVVLMSGHFMRREWQAGFRYLLPIVAFGLGVFLAERIGNRYKRETRVHWRQLILIIEIILLFAVGFMPEEYNLPANMIISATCAMQVQAFRKMNGYGYASTMCIGNLRSGTESLSIFIRERKKEDFKRALHYFGIIFVFAIGAGTGGILSDMIGFKAIFISCGLLLTACIMMFKEKL